MERRRVGGGLTMMVISRVFRGVAIILTEGTSDSPGGGGEKQAQNKIVFSFSKWDVAKLWG